MSRIIGYSLMALLLLGAVGQSLLYFPRLPDRMASHFNAAGQADGWMSKQAFFGVSLGAQAGMAVLKQPALADQKQEVRWRLTPADFLEFQTLYRKTSIYWIVYSAR